MKYYLFIKKIRLHLIDEWYNSFEDFKKANSLIHNSDKIVVFAHGLKNPPLPVLIGAYILKMNNYIDSNWFNKLDNINLGVFYTCFGARILSDNKWRTLLKQWVSFDGYFILFKGILFNKFNKELFELMFFAIIENSNAGQLKQTLVSIFENQMAKLKQKWKSSSSKREKSIYFNSMLCLTSYKSLIRSY